MNENSYKRLGLFSLITFFLTTLLLIPAANGVGGSSPSTAPTLAPGYYPNENRFGVGYYNVTGNIGSNLTAIITYELPNASKLILWAPNKTTLDQSNTESGVEVVSTICDSNQMYTLYITDPIENCIALNRSFTLTICLDGDCGQTDGGIPGFPLLYAVLGIMTLLGVAILSRKRINHFI